MHNKNLNISIPTTENCIKNSIFSIPISKQPSQQATPSPSKNTPLKNFKNNYLKENGQWNYKAVNDGFIEFNDYINDIKSKSETQIYDNKTKLTDYNLKNNEQKAKTAFSGIGDTINYILNQANNKVKKAAIDINDKAEKTVDFAKAKYKSGSDYIHDRIKRSEWITDNLGVKTSAISYYFSLTSENQAQKKAAEWGYDGVWNNKADAYRHFIWNAKMTREPDIGYYNARNITNRYEYEAMSEKNWISKDSSDFDYKKDNTIIKGQMNQETFMDLWNNQVGRELANNKNFSHLSEDELFDFAAKNNMIIEDANKVYYYLGISDYITNPTEYTVDVEWNLTTGTVTVKKDDNSVTLKIGI